MPSSSMIPDLRIMEENDAIVISAPTKTDFFNDTVTDFRAANAPFRYAEVDFDFVLRCRITPDFRDTYDAGCLLVYESDEKWIKFAFENTDLGYASMVAVVTNGKSDDANGERVFEQSVWMQIVRKGNNWCLHYSRDGENWKMVRYFQLEMSGKVRAGISAQSPKGRGCKVQFDKLIIMQNPYINIRKPSKVN